MSIRAYGMEQAFKAKSQSYIDQYNRSSCVLWDLNRYGCPLYNHQRLTNLLYLADGSPCGVTFWVPSSVDLLQGTLSMESIQSLPGTPVLL